MKSLKSDLEIMIFNNLLTKSGCKHSDTIKLLSNAEFNKKFNELYDIDITIHAWVGSHISMDGMSEAYNLEKKKYDDKERELCDFIKTVLS